jgi:hypothetical protein
MAERKSKEAAQLERELLKGRVRQELMRHVGRSNAIGMGELFELIYGEKYEHRINDTRRLRKVITLLRREGDPICSLCCALAPGYYVASVGKELEAYLERLRGAAVKKLALEAKIRRTSLPELLGQVSMAAVARADGGTRRTGDAGRMGR